MFQKNLKILPHKMERRNADGDDSEDPKTPRSYADNRDIFEFFYQSKPAKKTSTKKSTKKSLTATVSSPSVDLEDILKFDLPVTLDIKSVIDEVFAKWIEEDPYASISRYIPIEGPESPERPLTLFSPLKEDPRTFSTPRIRSRARKALSGSNADKNHKVDHKRTENLGPPDVSAYSPCNSGGNAFSRLNGSTWSCDNESVSYSPEPSCSTPLTVDAFKTPAPVNRSLPFAGEPLSGVKALFPDKSINGETDSPVSITHTPVATSRYTPLKLNSDTPARCGYSSLTVENLSNTSVWPKSTILFGITCYVEVRYNKEDRSIWVRNEVASLGAKVEMNFTKKVTLVIFKEGKISTYMKAKELNIPLVSLLWIDACKNVGGLVDPSQYAPTDDEKYQKAIPVEEARRRTRFLRRGQAFLDRLNGILPPKPPRKRSNKKTGVSATEGKRKNKVNAGTKQTVNVSNSSKGPKKLNFSSAGPSRCSGKKSLDSDGDFVSDADSEDNPVKRRKSAPADLGEGGQQKLTKFFNKKTIDTTLEDENLPRAPPKSSNQGSQKDLLNILTGGYATAHEKRLKLFDPNESLTFSPLVSGTPVELSPYIKVSPPSKETGSRTTSSKRCKEGSRLLKARKSLAPLMEYDEQDESHNRTSSTNSSRFVPEQKSKAPVKVCLE